MAASMIAVGAAVLLAPRALAAGSMQGALERKEAMVDGAFPADPLPGIALLQMDPPAPERQHSDPVKPSSQLDVGSRTLARYTNAEELERIRLKERTPPMQSYVKIMDSGICAAGFDKNNNLAADSVQKCSALCWADVNCRYFSFNGLTGECVPFKTVSCEKDATNEWPFFVTYEARWALDGKMSSRSRCDYSQDSCKKALETQGLQIGGGGFPFASEYKTSGCFYYYSGTLATMGFYGTVRGGGDLVTKEQLSALDIDHEQIARPLSYPACHQTGDTTPGCIRLGSITKDLANRNTGCEWGGMEWVNISDTLNLTNHDVNLEADWAKMSSNWTQDQHAQFLTVIRPGHRHECQRACRLQVYQRGKLCCYFNPATELGCFIKPQANVSVEGTGFSGLCDFGVGATE